MNCNPHKRDLNFESFKVYFDGVWWDCARIAPGTLYWNSVHRVVWKSPFPSQSLAFDCNRKMGIAIYGTTTEFHLLHPRHHAAPWTSMRKRRRSQQVENKFIHLDLYLVVTQIFCSQSYRSIFSSSTLIAYKNPFHSAKTPPNMGSCTLATFIHSSFIGL